MDISIKSITKSYGDHVLYQNYNLTIPAGTIRIVMGGSGLGKTTLLRMIAGLETPDSGIISGVPDRISMVFQEDRLCEELSAVENVRLVLPRVLPDSEHPMGIARQALFERIRDHLQQVGLPESGLDQPVREYSGGMKRRVAVVRAMMADSELLLLDEPCNGLDTDTRTLVIRYMMEHRRERTMVVVTHDAGEADFYGGSQILIGDESNIGR